MKLRTLLLFIIIIGVSLPSFAVAKKDSIVNLKPKERISFKTNTIDWALMVANAGFEYDLSSSPYNRYTLGLNVRYTGGASTSFIPKFDVKLMDVRAEFRRYWRQSMTMKQGQKKAPKLWRAYYWGVYAGYTDYTIFVPKGYEGNSMNLGGSFGYEMPLLKFKHGFLDLDLGINAGFAYQKYEKSKMEDDERVIVKKQGWKFTPYPMITEIRVGLVYRFKSIRDKYVKNKH